jgi:hypothetical protein
VRGSLDWSEDDHTVVTPTAEIKTLTDDCALAGAFAGLIDNLKQIKKCWQCDHRVKLSKDAFEFYPATFAEDRSLDKRKKTRTSHTASMRTVNWSVRDATYRIQNAGGFSSRQQFCRNESS